MVAVQSDLKDHKNCILEWRELYLSRLTLIDLSLNLSQVHVSSADVVPYPLSWWTIIAVVDSSLFSSHPRVRNCLHFTNLLNCQEDPNKPKL